MLSLRYSPDQDGTDFRFQLESSFSFEYDPRSLMVAVFKKNPTLRNFTLVTNETLLFSNCFYFGNVNPASSTEERLNAELLFHEPVLKSPIQETMAEIFHNDLGATIIVILGDLNNIAMNKVLAHFDVELGDKYGKQMTERRYCCVLNTQLDENPIVNIPRKRLKTSHSYNTKIQTTSDLNEEFVDGEYHTINYLNYIFEEEGILLPLQKETAL